jgi:hypothetical protein
MNDIHAEYSGDGERKDYHLTITVKNNLLLSMMKARGIESVSELSRQSGVSQGVLGDYLRLLKPACSPHTGDFFPSVTKLCEFFKCLPDHIFPEEHLHTPLETNTSSVEVSMEELKSIPGLVSSSPETVLISAEVDNALDIALNSLTARQQDVVRMRFGLLDGKEYTYREIGEKYDVSSGRVQQIEKKALRLLSHPARADKIRDALE